MRAWRALGYAQRSLYSLDGPMPTFTVILPRAEDVEGQPILRPLPSAKAAVSGRLFFSITCW
jgi:hypothetical protein